MSGIADSDDGRTLTRPAGDVGVDGDRHDESLWVLSVAVFEVILPFLLDGMNVDESVRVGGSLDEHQRWQVVQLCTYGVNSELYTRSWLSLAPLTSQLAGISTIPVSSPRVRGSIQSLALAL